MAVRMWVSQISEIKDADAESGGGQIVYVRVFRRMVVFTKNTESMIASQVIRFEKVGFNLSLLLCSSEIQTKFPKILT